MKYKNKI